VHTEPFAPCVRQWKQEIQSIADVITPEQCINELTKDGLETSREQLFDFCERYMSKSVPKQANATTIEQGTNGQTQQATTSQKSLKDGESGAT
jgi:chromo domain-containing protein 1